MLRTSCLGWIYTHLARSNWWGVFQSPALQHHCMPLVKSCIQYSLP